MKSRAIPLLHDRDQLDGRREAGSRVPARKPQKLPCGMLRGYKSPRISKVGMALPSPSCSLQRGHSSLLAPVVNTSVTFRQELTTQRHLLDQVPSVQELGLLSDSLATRNFFLPLDSSSLKKTDKGMEHCSYLSLLNSDKFISKACELLPVVLIFPYILL